MRTSGLTSSNRIHGPSLSGDLRRYCRKRGSRHATTPVAARHTDAAAHGLKTVAPRKSAR
jgi:hypothetical protein